MVILANKWFLPLFILVTEVTAQKNTSKCAFSGGTLFSIQMLQDVVLSHDTRANTGEKSGNIILISLLHIKSTEGLITLVTGVTQYLWDKHIKHYCGKMNIPEHIFHCALQRVIAILYIPKLFLPDGWISCGLNGTPTLIAMGAIFWKIALICCGHK